MLKCDFRNLERRSRKNRIDQSPARLLEVQQPGLDARRLVNRFDHRFHNSSGQQSIRHRIFRHGHQGPVQ